MSDPAPWSSAYAQRSWSHSLRFRLLTLGLTPLLLAFPVVIAVLGLVGYSLFMQQLRNSLHGDLSSGETYLQQLVGSTRQHINEYAKSDRLHQLLAQGDSLEQLETALQRTAEWQALDYLILVDREGRVIAASSGVSPGTPLPHSRALEQARLGMAQSGFERFDANQLQLLSPALALQAQASVASLADGLRPLTTQGLLIHAAVPLPLHTDTPDALLVGGMLLNGNTALVERMREVIFPLNTMLDNSDGVVALHLDDWVVAKSRRRDQTHPELGDRRPPELAQAVLTRKETWIGKLSDSQDVNHLVAFSPLLDNAGKPIGMLGTAFPMAPYQTRMWLMLGTASVLLALVMCLVSWLFLRTGQELTRRIQALNHTMDKVRQGEHKVRATPSDHDDELSRLKLAFNELLDTIDARDTALKTNNDSLRQLSLQLSEERRQLQQVILGTRAGTWGWNVQTGEAHFNERWAEIVGYQLEELGPLSIDTWNHLCHPDDLPLSRDALQRHFCGKSPYYDIEVRVRHRDGRWIWVHDRGQVFEWTEDHQPLWMFGTHLDISQRRQAEQDRTELLDRLTRLSVNVPGMLYQYRLHPDGHSCFPYASQGMLDIYGCSAHDVQHDAKQVFNVLHPDDRQAVAASIQASADTLQPWHHIYRVRHPYKGERWVEGNATPERNSPDGTVTWHGYIRDVTAQQHDQLQLKLAAKVYDASLEGIIITDANKIILDVNQAFTQITGFEHEEAVGQTPDLLTSGCMDKDLEAEKNSSLASLGKWKGEMRYRRKSGELFIALLSISTVRSDVGQLSQYVAIVSDITPLKTHEQELDRIANYDALTGIPNRRLLADRLQQAMAQSRREGTPLAICMLDLDGFKPVNDTHGHEAGDRLLVEIAQRLSHEVRGDETVARLGGDEFVLIFRHPESVAVFERVLDVVRRPVCLAPLSDQVARVSASMGITHFHCDGTDGDQLLREADHALYQSKQLGRNRYTVFQRD